MPTPRFRNNAVGTLTADSGLDAFMEVDAAFAALVTDASPNAGYYATLENAEGSQREIVFIKGEGGAQINTDRGQDGTGTYNWPAGTEIQLRQPAELFQWLKTYPGRTKVDTKGFYDHAIYPAIDGPYTHLTIDDNLTISIIDPTDIETGRTFEHTLVLRQDATGGRVVTWGGTNIKWAGGAAPTLSTGANDVDVLKFISVNGTEWLGWLAAADFS